MLARSAPLDVRTQQGEDFFTSVTSDRAMPVYALSPSAAAGRRGYNIWDFNYDQVVPPRTNAECPDISIRHTFPHSHPHFEIFWINAGDGLLSLDGEMVEAKPGSLLIIGPGHIHAWKRADRLAGTTLSFSEDFTFAANFARPFSDLTSSRQSLPSQKLQVNAQESSLIRSFLNVLGEPAEEANLGHPELLNGLLLILFSKLRDPDGSPARAAAGAPSLLTRQFQHALQNEYPRLTSVKEFAAHLNVSRSYLHRLVVSDTGATPHDLIRRRLILEAKRLLLYTGRSPAQISTQLGFATSAYFWSFFRRYTKQTPKAFRAQHGLQPGVAAKGLRG